jgi:hypothetical protein
MQRNIAFVYLVSFKVLTVVSVKMTALLLTASLIRAPAGGSGSKHLLSFGKERCPRRPPFSSLI